MSKLKVAGYSVAAVACGAVAWYLTDIQSSHPVFSAGPSQVTNSGLLVQMFSLLGMIKFGDPIVRQLIEAALAWWNAPKSVHAGVADVIDAAELLGYRAQYAKATDANKLTIRPVAKAEADALFDRWFPVETGG